MTDKENVVISRDGEGDHVMIGPNKTIFRIKAEETAGSWSLIEYHMPAESEFGPPEHTHPHQETFYVTEGVVKFKVGDSVLVAEAGTVVVVPGDAPHTFVNSGNTLAKMLIMFAPGGYEAFFYEAAEKMAGRDTLPSPEEMAPLLEKWQQKMVGPPLSK